jgi:hypothetical protein
VNSAAISASPTSGDEIYPESVNGQVTGVAEADGGVE